MQASEEAADDFACNRSVKTALDLASALIKVARTVPAGVRLPFSIAVAFSDGADVARRVERLIRFESNAAQKPEPRNAFLRGNIALTASVCTSGVGSGPADAG